MIIKLSCFTRTHNRCYERRAWLRKSVKSASEAPREKKDWLVGNKSFNSSCVNLIKHGLIL